MGQYDIFLIGGAAIVGGYFLLSNPDWINSLFPPVTDQPPPTEEPVEEPEEEEEEPPEDGNGNGGGDGGYDCKKACKNCWCRSYSENCSGSCSKCCGGSRIASKCNGQGVKTCSANLAYTKSLVARGYNYPYNNLRLTIA